MVRWLPNLTTRDAHFHKVWYWVQISGLTWEKMNLKNAEMIGAEIGTVMELEDPSVDMKLRGFLRVKVLIDSRNPLPTGFWLPLNSYTKTRVEFSYEGLRDFCYKCGRLGHNMGGCKNLHLVCPEEVESEVQWYGPWNEEKCLLR